MLKMRLYNPAYNEYIDFLDFRTFKDFQEAQNLKDPNKFINSLYPEVFQDIDIERTIPLKFGYEYNILGLDKDTSEIEHNDENTFYAGTSYGFRPIQIPYDLVSIQHDNLKSTSRILNRVLNHVNTTLVLEIYRDNDTYGENMFLYTMTSIEVEQTRDDEYIYLKAGNRFIISEDLNDVTTMYTDVNDLIREEDIEIDANWIFNKNDKVKFGESTGFTGLEEIQNQLDTNYPELNLTLNNLEVCNDGDTPYFPTLELEVFKKCNYIYINGNKITVDLDVGNYVIDGSRQMIYNVDTQEQIPFIFGANFGAIPINSCANFNFQTDGSFKIVYTKETPILSIENHYSRSEC